MAIETLFLAFLIPVRRLLRAFSIATYPVYFNYLLYSCYVYAFNQHSNVLCSLMFLVLRYDFLVIVSAGVVWRWRATHADSLEYLLLNRPKSKSSLKVCCEN